MTRSEWCALAETLGAIRERVEATWPPRDGVVTNAMVAHDRKLIRGSKLAAIDEVASALATLLKRRASRFDADRFLAMTRASPRG